MIRRLSRCIREYKWAALLSPLCMVGEVAMEVLIPLVMADLYDYGIKLQNMQVVAAKSGILVLCALASLAFGVLSAAFASKAGTGFAKTCAMTCTIRCRISAFPTSTNFPPLPSSPG